MKILKEVKLKVNHRLFIRFFLTIPPSPYSFQKSLLAKTPGDA